MNFSGLTAFPLTPMHASGIQLAALMRIIHRLTEAKVEAIGVLGSTGSYAYLERQERAQVARLALEHADGIPVMVGIGAVSTREVLYLAEDAQRAGAHAVMLAPVSYQKLTEDEVYGLYADVTRQLSVPLCVYDNPATTHFSFSDALHARIAQLPGVRAIKIPPLVGGQAQASERVSRLRAQLPAHVAIGISGDWVGLEGLRAGCDGWYSAIGGLLPEAIQRIVRAMQVQDMAAAEQHAHAMAPIFAMMQRYGSLRVTAAAAEVLGIVEGCCLPLPLQGIAAQDRQLLQQVLQGDPQRYAWKVSG